MKRKPKIIIIAAIILIIAAAAAWFAAQRIEIKKENEIEAEYLKKNLPSYSKISIVSDFNQKNNNTLAAFKEAARTGADVVTLDLCFDKDGMPVICADYSKINENTLPLAEVFNLMADDEYKDIQLNLRLRQLGSTDGFNKLVEEKGVSGRVIISGIDKERYGIIHGDKIAANLFYDYAPQAEPAGSVDEIKQLISQYHITGVILDYKDISDELTEALNKSGISYIVRNVNKKSEMYRAIYLGISYIQTENTAELNEIYDNWREATVNNIESAIDKSLKFG